MYHFSKLLFALLLTISLLSGCKPEQRVSEQKPENPEASVPSSEIPEETIILIGKITPMDRPASDIAYDYKLILDSPFTDVVEDGSGEVQHKEIILSGYDTETAALLQQALQEQQRVQIMGVVEWGYAEQRVFNISEIK